MEPLESIRENKLYWEDSFRTYGEHLLARLKERHPETQMIGKFSARQSDEPDQKELYYIENLEKPRKYNFLI